MNYVSQFEQDKWANTNIFRNKRNGVFVDIGAGNGIDISNSLFFERELGWTGVCVEPIPATFTSLKSNRNCICVEGAAWKTDETLNFTAIEGYSEMLSGITACYPDAHKNRINSEISQYSQRVQEIVVQGIDVNKILELAGNKIDILSVDTEGSELDILKAIQFDKFEIELIICENNYRIPEIGQLLAENGYILMVELGVDQIFIKRK